MFNLLVIPVSIIFGVILDRYVFPILDVGMDRLNNNNTLNLVEMQSKVRKIENKDEIGKAETRLEIALVQKELEELLGEVQRVSEASQIGFKMNKHPEDDYDFENEDFDYEKENSIKNTIGFKI